MRQERTVQASIFDVFARHEIGRELKAISQWLDEHAELVELVAADLLRHGVKPTGRQGLPAESVLRCGLLKQHRAQLSRLERRRPLGSEFFDRRLFIGLKRREELSCGKTPLSVKFGPRGLFTALGLSSRRPPGFDGYALFLSEKGCEVLSHSAQCSDGEVRSRGFAEGIVDKGWHISER